MRRSSRRGDRVERVDDAVDDLLDQGLIVGFAGDADHRLGAGRTHDQPTMAIETLGDDFMDERIFIQFAKFEIRLKEFERARALFKFALDRLPRSKSKALNDAYVFDTWRGHATRGLR